ncbi:hypothetical protein ABEO75_18825 [Paenibacillus macerans]
MNFELISWLSENSVFKTGQKFTSKSGEVFDYETDLRPCYSSFSKAIITSEKIIDALKIDLSNFDYFLGVPETGTLMAFFLNDQKRRITKQNFSVNVLRSHPKEYQASTYSVYTVLPLIPSERVCIVEDDVVTGSSLINCLRLTQDLGFKIDCIVSVIDREHRDKEGYLVKEKIESEFQVEYRSLITLSDIVNFLSREMVDYEI